MTKASLYLLLAPCFLAACSPGQQPVALADEAEQSSGPVPAAPVAPGSAKELVDIHCVRCHLAPKPEDLS